MSLGNTNRDARDLSAVGRGARRKARAKFRRNITQGIAGDPMPDVHMSFNSTPAERVIAKGGSYIVLGRDRNAGIVSGYGGVGDTNCDSIDFVVGRHGFQAAQFSAESNAQMYANPDFNADAARIYMSEKSLYNR